jgi:peptidoglycan lytic transglycosylase G
LVLVAAVAGIVKAVGWVQEGAGGAPAAPAADPHGPGIVVVVPTGDSATAIGSVLQDRGIVSSGSGFAGYAKSKGEGSDFKAGTYTFQAGTGYDTIIARLNAGPAADYSRLVIPEGFRLTEIERRLPGVGIAPGRYAAAVRAAVPPPGFGHHVNMEGFMFPATYEVRPHEQAATLVSQQLAAFRQAFAQVGMGYARSKNLSPYDVLIIASMIEREAKVPGDRAKVAAVIYNRLHRGMPLAIDATILYHLGSWTATIHQSDLASSEPYNTRVHHGLPPTPICNPGLAALQAAAHPAHVDYLYYVAVPGKAAQYFTSSYQKFLAHGG